MKRGLIVYVCIVITILLLLEGVYEIDYFMKQGSRIVLMLFGPLTIYRFIRKESLKKAFSFDQAQEIKYRYIIYLGVIMVVFIVTGYFLFQNMIDGNNIISGLNEIGINKSNIIFVSIYMTFGNSLLEEFFFRGVVEDSIPGEIKKSATSSALFALYHVLLMSLMFPVHLVIVAFIGLFLVGYVLSYINRFSKGFLNSYILHIFADLGVVIVGLYLMYTIG